MSNSAKNWQRPWSIEEIVNQADNWNLACDAALLNTLKAFGDRVLNVSEGVHEKVGHLCNNLNQISLRVDLARNEFNSICDSQFVECRVYEDDETLLTKEDQKGKVEYNMTENEKIEDLKKAVDLGLHILDEYYDKLEVPVSDSEEDEEVETPSYVYRRKDHYLHRPLPYVIGSEEWHKKWHVGLLESSDSEIEKSASDKFSDSEIDDDFEMKDQSDVSSEFSSAEDNLKGQKTINTSQPNDSFSSTGGPNLPSNTIPKGSTFAEQLAAKLGTIAKENEAFEESEVNRRPIHKKNTEYGALFSNEPPPLEDTVQQQQQTDGIFSSGKGLFDDEDDDNDTLWSYDKSKNTSSTDYLAFSRDGQFGERSIQRKGLFDEESDDDIFTENSYIKNQMKHPYLQHIKPVVPPFHEEPPLLENEQDMEANKKIDGSVSGFEKSDTNFQRNKLENISKKRIVKSSDECIEDTFCPNSIREVSKTNPISVSETDEISFRSTNEITHSNIPNISNAPKETKKIEDELQKKITDNLLEGINTSNLEIIKPTTEASYLFDDIFVDDLFSDTNKKFSSDLFTEEDLFPEKSIIKTSEPNKKSSYSTSVITSTKTFPEISDDESFEEKQADFKNDHDKSWRNISKNKVVSIFDDTDEDDFDTLISKKSNTVNDQNTKNLVQSEVQVCASEYSDVYPEFEPLEKGEVSIDIVPHEKIGRDEFITEKQVGQTYGGNSNKKNDKVHENTDDKYHEQCSWKQSFNIDDIHTVQNILQEQHLPIDDETSKYDFTTQSKETNDTIGSIAYSRSSDIPQVNFFDSTPPRDDGWDNNAANIFDDVGPYGIDDFQSRPSSLFDSEPPSLFLNDSSTVAQDILENRIDSVKYFDPNLTSSRRLSSDIFSDTDDDSNKVSKNIEYSDILIANSWTTDSIPGIPDFSSESNTDLTAIGSFDYIHSSASVNPAGEEIYPKSINREQSKESFKVDVDTPDELSGFSIQKPLCENEINSGDDKNNQKPTRRDSVKTDVFNKKQNGDISIDGEGKIEIENGKKLSVSGANTDKINTAHSLLDDSFDIGVDDDIFSDSDALLAEGEISSKQSDNGISASEITNMYIEKHIESGGSKISSDENPVVSYDDESSKKKISDMGFTHTTTQNNFEIIAKYPIETKPTTAQFKNTVHSEMEETSTFEVEHGDDFLDASSEYEKKSISLIHDSYDKEAKNIQSNSPMKKQDADINDCINRENVIRDNASVRKRVSFDENIVGNENNSREASVHREESDEMQNNISRIVERLQQISNIQEDNSKLSALPGKLSHKLDINVGALLPGSAPPRREKIQTPETKTEELNNEDPDFVRTPISILRTQSETHPITREYRLEKSVSFDNAAEVEVLHNVTKNRPKIPIKRRPSSRKARQQYLRNSVPDFQIEDESTLREKYEKRSVKDLSSKNSTDNQHLLVSQISTSKQDINMQNEIIQSLEYLSTKSPEHSLQVEKEMRNEPASRTLEAFNSIEEQKTILLFDDEEDDSESLFRIIQPNNGSTINHTKRVALKKEEPSPLKPDTTTGGIDELLDPLNDNEEIWERSTSFPKTKSPFTSSGETGVNESSSKRNEKVKISTTTLFDSSDEEDDFFNSLSKTKIGKQETNRSKTISNSKIGSKLFDDERTAEHDIEPSVIKKITPKSSNLRKLQNVEVEEDPLSAMLK